LMLEQANNMQRLVADLLTLSTLESEHNVLTEERSAIVPLMLELSNEAKALSKGQHELSLDIGDAENVLGSRAELASAFGRLSSARRRPAIPRMRIPKSSPIAQRRAEEALELVAPDVDGRILDHAILGFGARRKRVDFPFAKAERRQTVRHAGGLHHFDHAPS